MSQKRWVLFLSLCVCMCTCVCSSRWTELGASQGQAIKTRFPLLTSPLFWPLECDLLSRLRIFNRLKTDKITTVDGLSVFIFYRSVYTHISVDAPSCTCPILPLSYEANKTTLVSRLERVSGMRPCASQAYQCIDWFSTQKQSAVSANGHVRCVSTRMLKTEIKVVPNRTTAGTVPCRGLVR